MRMVKSALFLAAIALLTSPISAQDPRRPRREFRADLKGPTENVSILSGATGRLTLRVSDDDSSVHFVLQFQGLQTPVLFSHIHVGKPNDNGGVAVFFCGGSTTPPCPQGEGTVEGDFTADDVIGLPAQELGANDLAALLSAIRAGDAYANLHTMAHMGGEIRGQILPARRGED
jgi:hypothetical protein